MTEENNQINDAIGKLNTQLDQELESRQSLKYLNRNIGLSLGIGSIVFSCLAAIFGIFGNLDEDVKIWKILTPISAIVAATLQGALLGYPVDKRAVFHRLLEAQATSLKDELEIRQHLEKVEPDYLKEIIKQLQQIKLKGASEEPESSDKVSSVTLEQINDNLEQIKKIKAELEALKNQN